jgi:beta-lactamase regulating signal transducer with metallopeptidase domain
MRTFVEYGLANAVAATALALVVALVGTFIRRPAVRNALWILVFVRLVLPPFWTVPLPLGATQTQLEIYEIASPPKLAWHDEAMPKADSVETREPVVIDDTALLAVNAAAPLEDSETAMTSPGIAPAAAQSNALPSFALDIYVCVAAIWLAGSTFILVRSARRIIRFRRALSDATPAPAAIQEQAEALARAIGLRSCPRILIVPGRVWPSLWMPGLFARRARLIFPAGLLPLLDPAQRAAVLAHELSHLRRWDPWVRWLELIVCGIYWWHPLLGWFRRKLREAEEECCDMWVVAATGGRRSYATALVETVGFLGDHDRAPAPVLASGAGPVRNLQRRVTMIMRATWPARLTKFGLAIVLGVGGLALAFGPALAQPDRKERPVKDEERAKERPKERPDGPPREGERRKDGDRPKEGDRPREGERRIDNKELQEAREFVERARKEAHEAMLRLQEAEARLAKLEGRPVPPPREGAGRGPADRGPGDRPVERGPMDPRRPGVGDAPRGGGDLRDLQQQIEDLRRALEEMRRELRREGDRGRGPDPRPKEGDRPKDGDRPRDGDRPKDGGKPGVDVPGRPRVPDVPLVPRRPGDRN